MNNPVKMFDLTIKASEHEKNNIEQLFRKDCDRWCFQLERGEETGYEHYQCRISFKVKKRLSTAINWFNENIGSGHISVTCDATHRKGNMFYVMKEETRIDGPWSDQATTDEHYVPKRLRIEPEWRPWQQKVIDDLNSEPDDRTINVIIDEKGNIGKSLLTMYLAANKRARRIPQQKDIRDVMRLIMSGDPVKCYFIDFPRAISERDQNSMYAAIEEIKNGYCYDDRYKFRERYFDPPHVWIFTNRMPNLELASKDRWKLWTVKDLKLIPIHECTKVDDDDGRFDGLECY